MGAHSPDVATYASHYTHTHTANCFIYHTRTHLHSTLDVQSKHWHVNLSSIPHMETNVINYPNAT